MTTNNININDINIGDIIRIKKGARSISKIVFEAFDTYVIGKDRTKIFTLTSAEYGRIITDGDLRLYKVDKCFLGKYGCYFFLSEIDSIVKKAEKNINVNTKHDKWTEFIYGRQIKAEKESLPDIEQRPFEFL